MHGKTECASQTGIRSGLHEHREHARVYGKRRNGRNGILRCNRQITHAITYITSECHSASRCPFRQSMMFPIRSEVGRQDGYLSGPGPKRGLDEIIYV